MSEHNHTCCPSCNGHNVEVFFELDSTPINSCILLPSQDEARAYPRGQIRLGFCLDCGFIYNQMFKDQLPEYSTRYEETQSYSKTFNRYHTKLAQRLIEKYCLQHKHVVEIGCGKGEFLKMICEMGNNRGTGFDPGAAARRKQDEFPTEVTFIRDFFSQKYDDLDADIIICKMTLEHIYEVGHFVAQIRSAIGNRHGIPVFIQVPDASRILSDCAFEDIYYEHCSYFSEESLTALFKRNGFEIESMTKGFADQYLTIEVRSGQQKTHYVPTPGTDVSRLRGMVQTFPAQFKLKQSQWRECLYRLEEQRKKTVLWGAASKAVSLISTVKEAEHIAYGVDINPHKHGFFLPGNGLPIVEPDFLREYQPDQVIVMNSVYVAEIKKHIMEMGLNPDFTAL